MNKKTITKTLELPDVCSRCIKEPYGWFIENNGKIDYIALCFDHLLDFVNHVEKYEAHRN